MAGCKDDKQSASTQPGKDTAKASGERVVTVYCWSEYLPEDVRKKFTEKTGIKVNHKTFENNEKLLDELHTGVSDYDLVMPSDYTVQICKRQNLVQKIDKSRIPNWKNLDPKMLGKKWDPQNEYAVPYFWGTTGIGYAKKDFPSGVDSWKVMFDPKNAGKILMLKDARECMAAALLVMGKTINETSPDVLKQAGEMLKQQKKLVKAYDSDDFHGVLSRGEVSLAHGFNGQLAKVIAENKEKFGYSVPKEGATMWIDAFCIPAKAKNVDTAHEFLNFLLDPEIAGQLVNEVSYASAVAAAKGIKPEIRNDPNIYPPDDVVKRTQSMIDIGDQATELIDKIWEQVMAQ
jgi:spermidine/putrescine transport system substrate-binding protein